jgi:hypothetical protein
VQQALCIQPIFEGQTLLNPKLLLLTVLLCVKAMQQWCYKFIMMIVV